MKKLIRSIGQNWQKLGLAALAVVPLLVFFTFRLTTLTEGVSASELAIIQPVLDKSIHILDVLRTGVLLPYNLILFGLQFVAQPETAVALLRGVSVLLSLLAVLSFYRIARWQHSLASAAIGTVSFMTSAWLLVVGRTVSADIMLVAPIFLLALCVGMYKDQRKSSLLSIAILAPLVLYIPGMVWLLIPVYLLLSSSFSRQIRAVSPAFMLWFMGIGGIFLVPALVSFVWPPEGVTTLSTLRSFAGLPEVFPPILELPGNLLDVLKNLFFSGSSDPSLYIDKAPLVSFFVAITFILGLYKMIRTFTLDRSRITIAWLVIGSILTAIGGVSITLLLVPVFLASLEGIRFLFDEWFRVFPRNVFAKTVGVGLISVVVATSASYQLVSYFVAWPKTQSVKNTFNISVEK